MFKKTTVLKVTYLTILILAKIITNNYNMINFNFLRKYKINLIKNNILGIQAFKYKGLIIISSSWIN